MQIFKLKMEEPADCGMNVAEIDFMDVDVVYDVDDFNFVTSLPQCGK